MSHLTEGQLHAHLDGSLEGLGGMSRDEVRMHLSVCADCRFRLEAASEVRERASALLRAAAPPLSAPPALEELQQRAGRGGVEDGPRTVVERERRRGGAARPIAWAASLAVAVTAGWLARGVVGPPPLQSEADAARVEAEGLPAVSAAMPEEREELGRRAMQGAAERPTPLPSEAGATPRNEGSVLAEESGTATERLEKVESGSAVSVPLAAAGREVAAAGWETIGRERAEALLGGRLRTVEGLPVLSVRARGSGSDVEVWTAQQLPSGHTLNLWQVPVVAAASAEPEPGQGSAGVVPRSAGARAREADAPGQQVAGYEAVERVRSGGFLIEARAPLSADSLRALLARLDE